MANDTGATERFQLRMTPREREMGEEVAEVQGISLNAALRLLIRRGYTWVPDRTFAYPADTHGPNDPGKPAKSRPARGPSRIFSDAPQVPEGQMTYDDMEDQ